MGRHINVKDLVFGDYSRSKRKTLQRYWVRRKSDNVWLARVFNLDAAIRFSEFLVGTAGALIVTKGTAADGEVVFELSA